MSPRVKLVLLIVVIVIGATIGRTSFGSQFEAAKLISTLREMGSASLAIPLYLLLFGVATTLFTPAIAMMVAAGVTWGFWPGWLIAWLATNVWVHGHFLVGRWLAGREIEGFLTRRGAGWLLRELDQGGALTAIMVRQLPLPFMLVNLAAGASPMRWRKWAVGNAIAVIPNCLIYTQLAAALADGAEGAKQSAAIRVVIAASGMLALGLISRWLQLRFAKTSVGAGKEGAA